MRTIELTKPVLVAQRELIQVAVMTRTPFDALSIANFQGERLKVKGKITRLTHFSNSTYQLQTKKMKKPILLTVY